jgi:hypothetical protein
MRLVVARRRVVVVVVVGPRVVDMGLLVVRVVPMGFRVWVVPCRMVRTSLLSNIVVVVVVVVDREGKEEEDGVIVLLILAILRLMRYATLLLYPPLNLLDALDIIRPTTIILATRKM